MKPKEFLQHLDDTKVLAAIAEAEKQCSGEIRVFVSSSAENDPLKAAQQHFEKMGMTKTRERNGVLLYFAPKTQRFAIIGDQGLHEKCGPEFWEEIGRGMSEQLKSGRFTDSVVDAVRTVGAALAKYFPRDPDDRNELPDAIGRD